MNAAGFVCGAERKLSGVHHRPFLSRTQSDALISLLRHGGRPFGVQGGTLAILLSKGLVTRQKITRPKQNGLFICVVTDAGVAALSSALASYMPDNTDEWRSIPGIPYEASASGKIRNSLTKIMLRQNIRQRYFSVRVQLASIGLNRTVGVHRLVCMAFHGDSPFEGAHVRHLDGNQFNNHEDNLAWGSAIDNEADKRRHGRIRMGAKNHKTKISDKQAIDIRNRMKAARGADSSVPPGFAANLAEEFRISVSTVRQITRGYRSWKQEKSFVR